MLRWLLPKEEHFFKQMEASARNALKGAQVLRDTLHNYTEADAAVQVAKINEIEHQGDIITHSIMNNLNNTFVTPIDREDIHALAISLDNVIDFINAGASRLVLFGIKQPTPEMVQLADVVVKAAQEIVEVVPMLDKTGYYEEIRIHLEEINRLENEGDRIHHTALKQLFETCNDAKEIIKVKELLEFFETSADMCEKVAHVIEGIVVKNK